MPNHELYQSAMDKLMPSAAWQQDTLNKLAAARAEMQAEQADAEPKGKAKSKTVRFQKAKKAAIPLAAAAAVALAAIPAAMSANQSSLLKAASPDSVLQNGDQLPCKRDVCPEPYTDHSVQPELAAQQTELPVIHASDQPSFYSAKSSNAAEDFDIAGDRLLTTANNEALPQVVWHYDKSGMGRGTQWLIRDLSDLDTSNPTQNLPQDQLPTQLPVWQAPTAADMTARMQQAADLLSLTLIPDPVEECPKGYPRPELWPDCVHGHLVNPDLYQPDKDFQNQPEGAVVWEVQSYRTNLQISRPGNMPNAIQQHSSDAQQDSAQKALDQFSRFMDATSLILSPDPVFYSDDGTRTSNHTHFWHSPSHPEDSIDQQLLDYSFKTLTAEPGAEEPLAYAELGRLPDSPLMGLYPVRSLEDAKAALKKELDKDAKNGFFTYDLPNGATGRYTLTPDDIVGWKLQYHQDFLSPTILPVYTFTLRIPVPVPEIFPYSEWTQDPEEFQLVKEYTVSALPDDCCVDWA